MCDGDAFHRALPFLESNLIMDMSSWGSFTSGWSSSLYIYIMDAVVGTLSKLYAVQAKMCSKDVIMHIISTSTENVRHIFSTSRAFQNKGRVLSYIAR